MPVWKVSCTGSVIIASGSHWHKNYELLFDIADKACIVDQAMCA
jgi:hypothetical protein